MKVQGMLLAAALGLGGTGFNVEAAPVSFATHLGNFENPPTGSAGVGYATVTMDVVANTLTVDVSFSGLTGLVTAAHIHCCIAPPGNAGVATTSPTFPGFPSGVTAGSYSNTFDTTLAGTFNAAFITASGGTVAGAEAALFAGLVAGQAYFNIHTATFPGGEIRGFLSPVKGDFNADGVTDMIFRQVSNGAHNKVWFMDGITRTAEAAITPDAASAAWLIRGADDFDGDSATDLVFWNQSTGNVEFWMMSGTNRPSPPVALTGGAVLATNWDLSATADFNHDDNPDIVWRNFTSQKIVIWKMGEGAAPGTEKTGNIIPSPDQAVDFNWLIVAAADYNNDGDTDFLWYNFNSGRIVTWYMNASVVRISGQFTTPNAAGDANWKVVASADYSRSYVPGTPPIGSPDVVWRNATSGNQVVWHFDFNSTRVHGQFTNPAANSPALDWVIVGPR